MTLQEARGIVSESFPGRTVCVQAQAWRNAYTDGSVGRRTDFTISIQPGINGAAVTGWESPTIAGALAKLRDDMEPYPVTDEPIEATGEDDE